MSRVNELINKSKGIIIIEKNKVLKGVKHVYRDGMRLFTYTLNNGKYLLMPCGANFYYTSSIEMSEEQFAYLLAGINIQEEEK